MTDSSLASSRAAPMPAIALVLASEPAVLASPYTVAALLLLIGGFGFTALTGDDVVVVPILAGLGARLGVNVGYLKFTPRSTWNPF